MIRKTFIFKNEKSYKKFMDAVYSSGPVKGYNYLIEGLYGRRGLFERYIQENLAPDLTKQIQKFLNDLRSIINKYPATHEFEKKPNKQVLVKFANEVIKLTQKYKSTLTYDELPYGLDKIVETCKRAISVAS